MGSGPTFNWTQPPFDDAWSPQTNVWATDVNNALNSLIQQVYPPVAPQVSARGENASVLLSWNEVPGASLYQIYQNSTNVFAGASLVGTVPSNQSGPSNSFLVGSLENTNTQYYFVQPVTAQGQVGAASSGTAGAASGVPLPFSTTLGQIPDGDGYNKLGGVTSGHQATTPSYGSNTVSSWVTAQLASEVALIYNTYLDIMDLSLTPDNGIVIAWFDGEYDNTSANQVPVIGVAYENGSSWGQGVVTLVPFQSAGAYASFSFTRPDLTPGTSSNTYSFYANLQQNVSNPVYCNTLTLTIVNLKV